MLAEHERRDRRCWYISGEARTYKGEGPTAHLVEGAVLVVLGEGVLLQEVVLQEARRLQDDLVTLRQRVLRELGFRFWATG